MVSNRRSRPIIIDLGDLWMGFAGGAGAYLLVSSAFTYMDYALDWKYWTAAIIATLGVGISAKIRGMVHVIR